MDDKRYCIYCGDLLSDYDLRMPTSEDVCAHCFVHEEEA